MPNPGAFLGLRKEFIESQSAAYAKAVASGQVSDVLADIQRRYFKRFPPGLEHNVDPTKEWLDQVDDAAPDVDIPAPNADLPLEEFRRESARYEKLKDEIKTRKEQIKRRLHYIYTKSRERETTIERNSSDALSVLAAKLSGASLNKPRKKTPANLWGPQNRALVDPIFSERVEQDNVPSSQHLKLRSAIYKEMFEALPQAEQDEWQERADREHEAHLKAQKDAMNAPPSTAPADRQRVITAIPKLVEPILDLIGEYTGWKGSLIIGGPEPGDNGRLNMISIHFGVTQGTVKMDFGRSERLVFKNHVQPAFGRFLKKCFSVDDCRAMALPVNHQEVTLSTVATEEDVDIHHFDTKVLPALIAHPHAPAKAKGAASSTDNTASGSQIPPAAVQKPGEDIKRGPTKGHKHKAAARVAPVGVAKDKVLEPPPKVPAPLAMPSPVVVPTQNQNTGRTGPIDRDSEPPATLQSNQGEGGDVSRDVNMNPPPKTRSPAPTPPPSRPPSPDFLPSGLHQVHLSANKDVDKTPDTNKSDLVGAFSFVDHTSTSTTPEPSAGVYGSADAEGIPAGASLAGVGQKDLATAVTGHATGAASPSTNTMSTSTAAETSFSDITAAITAASTSASTTTAAPTSVCGSTTTAATTTTPATSICGSTTTAAATSISASSIHPPGAATVPDSDALDALVAAKAQKRRTTSQKEANSRKRKADDAVADDGTADAPNKKSRTDTTPAFAVPLPNSAPAWVRLATGTFTSISLGGVWEALVSEWLRFEEAQDFVKDGGSLSSFGRPEIISAWIKRARKGTPREGLGSPEAFETRFMVWWRGLQPEERFGEGGGQLKRGEADWECLRISGQNGLLSVVAALFFWGTEVMDHAARRHRWALAVDDVQYALEQLNHAV